VLIRFRYLYTRILYNRFITDERVSTYNYVLISPYFLVNNPETQCIVRNWKCVLRVWEGCTNVCTYIEYMYNVRNDSIEHIVSYLDQGFNVSEWNVLKPLACLSEWITDSHASISYYHCTWCVVRILLKIGAGVNI